MIATKAFAWGTPVVAFQSAALAKIVENGRFGFLVDRAEEMAEATPAASALNPDLCRTVARVCFSSQEMIRHHFQSYSGLLHGG
ncbi:MAG: hypothetical protein M1570_02505 [Chloroflexi bacterium]|nr:hypothetical protein [Chloroflexota bacterium]